MSSWIAKKKVDWTQVQSLLDLSLVQNQMTNGGPAVRRLEQEIRHRFQIPSQKAIIVVTNGSVAIHSVISSIEYDTNRFSHQPLRWATQSFTFPPSAQSVLSSANIVDICCETGGLDLAQVNPDEIDGLIVTNIFGNLVPLEEYEQWCQHYGKFLIFDNAATAFSEYKGQNSCVYGTASTLSFHHTKPFGFGEGGAIIIDEKYESIVRAMNNFGIGLHPFDYCLREGGNNYKMSDIQAAFLLQFWSTSFDQILDHHSMMYWKWKQYLEQEPFCHKVRMFPNRTDPGGKCVVSCFALLFVREENAQRYLKWTQDHGYQTRQYYYPLSSLEESPQAHFVFHRIVCVPCTIETTQNDLDHLSQGILEIL